MATAGELLAAGSTVADGSTAALHVQNLGGGGGRSNVFFLSLEADLNTMALSAEIESENREADSITPTRTTERDEQRTIHA